MGGWGEGGTGHVCSPGTATFFLPARGVGAFSAPASKGGGLIAQLRFSVVGVGIRDSASWVLAFAIQRRGC